MEFPGKNTGVGCHFLLQEVGIKLAILKLNSFAAPFYQFVSKRSPLQFPLSLLKVIQQIKLGGVRLK